MPSATEIANLAMIHMGAQPIANIDTEKSVAATTAKRLFALLRDLVLRDFPWPFSTKIITMQLVEEDPNEEWAFSYRYPPDSLKLRRILSGVRNDTANTQIRLKITRDDSGLLILTDQSEAELEYTFRETDTGRFPADFTNALALLLAANMAPKLTGGDPFNLGARAFQRYVAEISIARGAAADEESLDRQVESEFVLEREGDVGAGTRQPFSSDL